MQTEMFNRKKSIDLADKIIEAEAALSQYLRKCFPAGAKCDAMLMSGQINPTPATIVSITPDIYGGHVNVSIDCSKAKSSRRFRSISARDVSNVRAAITKAAADLAKPGSERTALFNVASISDDDLCSSCKHCDYKPGELSSCSQDWPNKQAEDYVTECSDFLDEKK